MDEDIRRLKEAKELITGLDKIPLVELLLYINELISTYENQHKV